MNKVKNRFEAMLWIIQAKESARAMFEQELRRLGVYTC